MEGSHTFLLWCVPVNYVQSRMMEGVCASRKHEHAFLLSFLNFFLIFIFYQIACCCADVFVRYELCFENIFDGVNIIG
jgi:hypothetical protein